MGVILIILGAIGAMSCFAGAAMYAGAANVLQQAVGTMWVGFSALAMLLGLGLGIALLYLEEMRDVLRRAGKRLPEDPPAAKG